MVDGRARSPALTVATETAPARPLSLRKPMTPFPAVIIGIVLFVLVGIVSFYLSQASNSPEGNLQGREAPDTGPR